VVDAGGVAREQPQVLGGRRLLRVDILPGDDGRLPQVASVFVGRRGETDFAVGGSRRVSISA